MVYSGWTWSDPSVSLSIQLYIYSDTFKIRSHRWDLTLNLLACSFKNKAGNIKNKYIALIQKVRKQNPLSLKIKNLSPNQQKWFAFVALRLQPGYFVSSGESNSSRVRWKLKHVNDSPDKEPSVLNSH